MNRTAALLLSLTTLLAHSLLIHQDNTGLFAPPFETAHATFRVARNLVYSGEAAWNPGAFVLESSASPVWVLLCSIAERFYFSVTAFAQTLGIVCMLATVYLAARFTGDRLVGVIAPFLLVVNGGIAAAGPGGTETALLTLLVTAAFLAHERRLPGTFAAVASTLWVTRWEGGLVVLVLLAFELLRAHRKPAERGFLRAFLVPLLVGLAAALIRLMKTGELVSPGAAGLAHGSLELGVAYLVEGVLASGTPLLVVIPLAYLVRGRLVGRARRGLLVALVWTLAVAWTGGDSLPFWSALVPVLPLLFLAVQDAVTLAVDGRRPWVTNACIALLLVGGGVSILASKLPGKIGPLPRLPLPRTWIDPNPLLAETYERPPGRGGLVREINETDRLRCIGVFLRDNLGPRATVLTPWPGALGYLSRRVVSDLRGRVTLSPGRERPAPWYGGGRTDVLQHFELEPDYIAGWIAPGRAPSGREELVGQLLARFDIEGNSAERLSRCLEALADYELIAIPVPAHSKLPDEVSEYPAYLLRRGDLRLTPKLKIEREGRAFRVDVRHRGHYQLADLVVTAEDAEGQTWSMRPTGTFERGTEVRARTRLLLYSSGSRSVELASGNLPEELAGAVLRAELRNPGSADPTSREAVAE